MVVVCYFPVDTSSSLSWIFWPLVQQRDGSILAEGCLEAATVNLEIRWLCELVAALKGICYDSSWHNKLSLLNDARQSAAAAERARVAKVIASRPHYSSH